MTTERTDGGAAFPARTAMAGLMIVEKGMTLRDYFAAKATPRTTEARL